MLISHKGQLLISSTGAAQQIMLQTLLNVRNYLYLSNFILMGLKKLKFSDIFGSMVTILLISYLPFQLGL